MDQIGGVNVTLVVAIITAVVTIITTVLAGGFKILEIWYVDRVNKRKKRTRPPLNIVAKFSMEMDKVLYDIMRVTDSDRVVFAQFHNGGKFITGVDIDKFTVTNEVFSIGMNSTSMYFQNVLLSTHASAMYKLLFDGEIMADEAKMYSCEYKKTFVNEVESVYMFLIKDIDDTPVGFVYVAYLTEKHILVDSELMYVRSKHDRILNLAKYKKLEDSE